MGADILERLRELFRHLRSESSSLTRDGQQVLRDMEDALDENATEIGRLRGEVEELKTRRAEDVSILDDIRDAIGGGPYDTIAKRIRKAIAPAEAKAPAPAMPNGVEVPPGWKIEANGEALRVTRPDGVLSAWLHRPTTNGSGMYDLCMDLLRAADNRDAAGVDGCPLCGGTKGHWEGCHAPVDTTPAAVPVGEAVALYQLRKADGSWIDQSRNSYDYNMANGHADDLRIVYTTPPAPVQAAPQEGEAAAIAAAFREVGACSYAQDSVAGELFAAVRKRAALAAHPSACELGAVLVPREVARQAVHAMKRCQAEGSSAAWEKYIAPLEAALQHRGDSRGGEG